jgi:hypothetical protein
MNVRPEFLATSEGALVSISIAVQPSLLESLLEALAGVTFPVNPQIYHDAAIVSRFSDGHEEAEAITLVEFPGYAGRIGEVRLALQSFGFDPASMQVTGMLEQIQSESHPETVPAGAPYISRARIKHRTMAA